MTKANLRIYSNDLCIACGKCIKVCPEFVLHFTGTHKVENDPARHCVNCGQCVCICPVQALQHPHIPYTCIHPFSKEECPTPEQLLLLCKKRRSTRNFKRQPIPKDILTKIVEAGNYAPTANNCRSFHFTVVTSPEKLRLLSEHTVKSYSRIFNLLNHAPIIGLMKLLKIDAVNYLPDLQEVLVQYKKGTDYISRGATAAIIITADSCDFFARDSANLAYQNMSLMAESLGIGQFYMGFVCSGISLDPFKKIAKAFSLKDKIYAIMALGIPDIHYTNYPERDSKEPVQWI